jgi:hydroxymethylbilane synthase
MTTALTLRIATRSSPLAQHQAQWVGEQLSQHHPTLKYTLVPILTEADQHTASLSSCGGKGVFVKAIQQAVLDGHADIAVHSAKDMPSSDTPGLSLACVPQRSACHDVCVAQQPLAELPPQSRIGTSSPRRADLLKQHYAHLTTIPIRGNVQTRIEQWQSGHVDGLILAAAGLMRLGLTDTIIEHLDPKQFIPSAGQGTLAIECRSDDNITEQYLKPLNDSITQAALTAERACMRALGGHCHAPIAAYAYGDTALTLTAWVGNGPALYAEQTQTLETAESLGFAVAETLNQQGAQTRLLKP